MKKRFTEEDIVFLQNNYKLYGVAFCAKALNRSLGSIKAKAGSLGIKSYICKPRMGLKQFENIIDPKIAYILGILWADGWIGPRQVCLDLVKEDMLNIKKIFNSIGEWSEYETKRRPNKKTGKLEKERLKLAKFDENFANLLAGLGFKNKSQKFSEEIFNAIPEELHFYFWRGFLDGDGCIYVKPNGGHIITFSCPIDYEWGKLEDLLNKLEIKFSFTKIEKNEKARYSRVVINGISGSEKFLRYIYKNRELDGIGLDRKYKKFLSGIKLTKNKECI